MKKQYLTRKDLARILEISVDQVRKNEHRLGLDAARCDLNPRCIRYQAALVLLILARKTNLHP